VFGNSQEPGLVDDISAQDVLDALGDATVIMDANATIVAVNEPWRRFCIENGGNLSSSGLGVNYLDVCRRSAQAGSREAAQAAACIRRVLDRVSKQSFMEYECSSPTERRWFVLRVTPLDGNAAMASHLNITARRNAERQAAIAPVPFGAGEQGRKPLPVAAFAEFSAAEREVVARLLRGYRVNAIAAELYVSPSTVRSQLSSAFGKVGVSSQQELIDLVRGDVWDGR
jgi:DNA-binding NarL/FixJ family response regulator